MIIKGGARSAGNWFAKHLSNTDDNEKVTLCEMKNLAAETMPEAFQEMRAVAMGTKATNYFYHVSISPLEHEHLTPEQWEIAVDRLEKNLGLEGHARFVVEHTKDGRTHRHVIWSRIDVDRMIAVDNTNDWAIHQATSRELEIEFGLERGKSTLGMTAEGPKPARRPEGYDYMRGKKTGIDPKELTKEVRAIWDKSATGKDFVAALDATGMRVVKGDRTDFCIIDRAGKEHSLARRTLLKVAEIRKKMKDVDRDSLPTVAQAKAEFKTLQSPEHVFAWRQDEQAAAPGETPTQQPTGKEKPRGGPPGGKDAKVIYEAIGTAESGIEFVKMLRGSGLELACVTAQDAQKSVMDILAAKALDRDKIPAERRDRFPPELKEGELVAVNQYGTTTRINFYSTGYTGKKIEEKLKNLDRGALPDVSTAALKHRQPYWERAPEGETIDSSAKMFKARQERKQEEKATVSRGPTVQNIKSSLKSSARGVADVTKNIRAVNKAKGLVSNLISSLWRAMEGSAPPPPLTEKERAAEEHRDEVVRRDEQQRADRLENIRRALKDKGRNRGKGRDDDDDGGRSR